MSLRVTVKVLGCLGLTVILWSVSSSVGRAQTFGAPVAASGSCNTCATPSCQWLHCPPAYKHCMERPPHIHWHCGCPHPICNPCDLPHFGYWETCWSPWPFPPSWAHCLTPPPAAFVNLNPLVHPNIAPPKMQPSILPPTGSGIVPPTGSYPSPGVTPMPMPMGPRSEEIPQPRRVDPR